jgi:hypothetical protein
VVDADAAYSRLHRTGEPKPLRAALEMGLMLGGGTSWYWITRKDNARDWDATDLAGRFNGRDWRIDNNGLDVNFFYHAMSGTAYYGIARANHLGMPVAYAYSFTSSFLWDFALEFNERISISDVLVTPSAGLVFAEYLHKLSWYLNSVPARPSTAQSIVRWTPVGASVAIHRAWDGQDDPVVEHTDSLGYDADFHHQFRFDYGVGETQATGYGPTLAHTVRHSGELFTLPGFLRPGAHSRFFARADFSTIDVIVTASEHGAGLDARGDATLLGWFAQSLDARRDGAATALGVNLAHRYLNTRTSGLHDFFGILHLPGPGADVWLREGVLRLHLGARAGPDFAGIGSHAYPLWREQNRRVRTKNVLSKQSYTIGWGASARLFGELSLGPAALSWRSFVGHYDSQEGLDRAQDEVEVDLDTKDTIAEWAFGLDLSLVDVERTGWGLSFGGELSTRDWSSKAGEYWRHTETRDASGRVRVVF